MKAYKYRGGVGIFDEKGLSFFERDISTLFENKIYAPSKEKLNDPTENMINDKPLKLFFSVAKPHFKNSITAVETAYNGLCNKIAETGVYSLSKTYSNELLWAYYGGGHTGFCIEYDIDVLIESINYNDFTKLVFDFDIAYRGDIPTIDMESCNMLSKDAELMVKIYIGTKSRAWKHEEEYRLLFNKASMIDIDYKAVTGIYFGCKMSDCEIDTIMKGLQGRGIKYYKMEFEPRGYKLKRIPIEDSYADAPEYIANDAKCGDWFLSEDFMGETYRYKDKLIEALKIVKRQPLITEIYQGIVTEDTPPIFKIFAYTGNKITPVRKFGFTLNNDGNLIKATDVKW